MALLASTVVRRKIDLRELYVDSYPALHRIYLVQNSRILTMYLR